MTDGPVDDEVLMFRRAMLKAARTRWERERSEAALEEYTRESRKLARIEKAVAEFPTASELARRKERGDSAEGRP